jgi:single-strand DNA-binding protein
MTTGFNRVTLFGNLGAEPELRNTPSGHSVLKFSLATNEVWFDKEQNKQERTEWHKVVMFGTRAPALSRLLTKGSPVLVEGRIQTSSYEKDGVKRYSTEIVASDLCFAQGRGASPRPAPAGASAELEDNVPF